MAVIPLLGPNQRFPLYCAECGEWLGKNEDILMQPVLCEGELVSMGRFPDRIAGPQVPSEPIGRVLFARWIHRSCSDETEEPEWLKNLRENEEKRERRSMIAARRESVRATWLRKK